jgi:tetratricopeptide (TPR) repeat protein
MGKKRKRNKRSNVTDLKAIYNRGLQLYLEKNKINEAVEWFKKAQESNGLFAPAAYYYGVLLIEERGDIERGNRYLDKAAEDGY